MAILIKIKSSTLIETLVATVLIVVTFILSSLILNNLLLNQIKNETTRVNSYLNELMYGYINENIKVPFEDNINDWKINITKIKEDNMQVIQFEAVNKNTNKTLLKKYIETN